MANRTLYGPQVKYGSTDAQRQQLMAQQLLKAGVDTSPVQGGWGEALARIGTAGIGGYLSNQAGETEKAYQSDRAKALAAALSGDPNQAAAGLMANPSTADMGAQLALGNMEYGRKRGDQLSDRDTEWGRQDQLRAQEPPKTRVVKDQGREITQEWDSATRTYREIGKTPIINSASVDPSDVREWQFYSRLPPEVQEAYLTMKRANRPVDIGGSLVVPSQVAPGQAVGVLPKTLAPQDTPEVIGQQATARAGGQIQGEAAAQAKIDLPKLEGEAKYTSGLLDEIIKHPGLKGVVGIPSVSGALRVPGTDEANFRARLDQLQGKQFLQAYNSLKGGGSITEPEGRKAEVAIARMQTAQTETEFLAAANEFKQVIDSGMERARRMAGTSSATSTTPPPYYNALKIQSNYR